MSAEKVSLGKNSDPVRLPFTDQHVAKETLCGLIEQSIYATTGKIVSAGTFRKAIGEIAKDLNTPDKEIRRGNVFYGPISQRNIFASLVEANRKGALGQQSRIKNNFEAYCTKCGY